MALFVSSKMLGQKLLNRYKHSGLKRALSRSQTWLPALSLRYRLILWYITLSTVLLAVMGLVTNYRMQSLLTKESTTSLKDNYRLFKTTAKTAGLPSAEKDSKSPNLAIKEFSNDDKGVLSIYRIMFPSTKIQVEILPFLTKETIRQHQHSSDNLLKEVRNYQQQDRRFVTGVSSDQYIALKDEEILQLLEKLKTKDENQQESFTSISINRSISEYGRPAEQYQILVFIEESPYPFVPSDISGNSDQAHRSENAPYYITYVGRSMELTNTTLQNLRGTLISVGLIGIIFTALVTFLVTSQALKPLQRVRRAAENITGQSLTTRVPEPSTKDEVEDLAKSINSMLDRLENSFEAQQRFTSDASHELRTPITAISGHAGYLMRRTDPTQAQQESLNIIKQESERLTNLVSNLLQLARSDGGVLKLDRGPVFSLMFLNEVANELAVLANAQGSQIQVIGPDISFEGDQDRLKQVLINLVANSLKAGAKYVRLRSSQQSFGEEIRLTIEDNGPGIAEEHLKKLFDRFYRVEDSRSRDQGGAGLGLSIVKSIVDAHDGRIWLESKVGIGTTAHIQLPIGNVPQISDEDIP